MPVQLEEKHKKSQARPTAGPSADDRSPEPATSSKPIEGRLVNVVGGSAPPRIMIAGGSSAGVRVGMHGYIRDGADGMLGTLVIDAVEAERSYAVVEVARERLRANARIVIGANAPKQNLATSGRIIGRHVVREGVELIIAMGTDQGVYVGMKVELIGSGQRSLAQAVRKVEGRRSHVVLEHTTLTEAQKYTDAELVRRSSPVQRRASGERASAADAEATAQGGVASASSQLPFLDVIQRSFGKHDVSGVRAEVGGPAAAAADALGARAYATGDRVAFAAAPDLHTAAHEAAHTVQQARGAVGFQGLGAADDEHERHADAVADAVVAGSSAETLLDGISGSGSRSAVQRKQSEQDAILKSPFHAPMRNVVDWRTRIIPRRMPKVPRIIECTFDRTGPRGQREHPAKHAKPRLGLEDTTDAWGQLHSVSSAVQASHERLSSEVGMYVSASTDPALHALLVGAHGGGSLSQVVDEHHSPERDGIQIGDLFDDSNTLALDDATHAQIARADRSRTASGQAVGATLEKGAALKAAIETLNAAVAKLGEARSDVVSAQEYLREQRGRETAADIQTDIATLEQEAAHLKQISDVSFATLAGFVHAAKGETGDMISKVGELVGTLLSRTNDRAIRRLNEALEVTHRTMRTARGNAIAAQLDARKSGLRAATHGVEAARNVVVQATAGRSTAYKQLGQAASSELAVSATEKRKVSAMIAALPLIEHVAMRARSIMQAAVLPTYSEPAGHALWLAHEANDPRVHMFMAALGEIEGARTLYRGTAVHWQHRLEQVRALANSVGSHEAE